MQDYLLSVIVSERFDKECVVKQRMIQMRENLLDNNKRMIPVIGLDIGSSITVYRWAVNEGIEMIEYELDLDLNQLASELKVIMDMSNTSDGVAFFGSDDPLFAYVRRNFEGKHIKSFNE